MGDFSKSVMVALLPTTSEWCKIDLPHLTLVYAGEIEDLPIHAYNELSKAALGLALTCAPLTLRVTGTDLFGDREERVDVIRLELTPQLDAMRSVVERWNSSKHPFNPHVTAGPVGSLPSVIPQSLSFDRVALGWGDDLLTYRMI